MSHKIHAALLVFVGLVAVVIVFCVAQANLSPRVSETAVSPSFVEGGGEESTTNPISTKENEIQFIYQKNTIANHGSEEWANDDLGLTELFAYNPETKQTQRTAKVFVPGSRGGSIVTYVFGQDLLVHRYSDKGDAILALDGTVKEIPETWNKLRSDNSEWEVELIADDVSSEGSLSFRLAHVPTGEYRDIDLSKFFPSNDHPMLVAIDVDDSGEHIVYKTAYGAGGGFPYVATWIYNVSSGTLTDLSNLSALRDLLTKEGFDQELYTEDKMYDWFFDRAHNVIVLTISTMRPAEEPGMVDTEAGGPSRVYLIDTENNSSRLVLENELLPITNVVLSPDGQSISYSHTQESDAVWVTEIGQVPTNKDVKVSGKLLDWVDHYLVVQRNQDILLYDLADPSGQSLTVLASGRGSYSDADYQDIDYIGYLQQNSYATNLD